MEKIIIREAGAEDAKQLLEYTKLIGKESENLSFGKEGLPITLEQEEAFLKRVHNDKASVYLIVCKNDEIIASGSLCGLPRRMQHRSELALSVKKDYWNQGIGGLLMEKLIAYAREHGIELLNLEVRGDNHRAIHLYEKFGFQHIGTSPAYFKINGDYVDFELMYLDLRKG